MFWVIMGAVLQRLGAILRRASHHEYVGNVWSLLRVFGATSSPQTVRLGIGGICSEPLRSSSEARSPTLAALLNVVEALSHRCQCIIRRSQDNLAWSRELMFTFPGSMMSDVVC